MGAISCYLADRNECQNPPTDNPCSISSNVQWAATAPLAAMLTTPLSDRAVSLSLGTGDPATGAPIAPVTILLEWEYPIFLTCAALEEINLQQYSGYRMEAFADAGLEELVATTLVDGVDAKVVPPLTDPADLPAGAPNQMRGDLDPRDLPLVPMGIRVVVPQCRVRAIRWSLWGDAWRPDLSPDTGYRIGLAWAGDGLIFSRHVSGKTGEGVKDNDQLKTDDDGSVWVEPGITKRTVNISRGVNDKKVRDTLFRMALRSGKRLPLLYVPNIDDPGETFLYGGLYRRTSDHDQTYVDARFTSSSTDLEGYTE